MMGRRDVTLASERGAASAASRLWRWALSTRTLPPTRLTRGDWIHIISVYAISRILIIVVGLVGAAMLPAVSSHQTWVMQPITWQTLSRWPNLFDHFDAGFYIGVSHGYPAVVGGNTQALRIWAFLPGYPLVLHVVAVIFTVLHIPGPVDLLAGIFVSYATLFGALVYLYRLTAAELDTVAARRAVTYLLVFPTSIFLSVAYPEALLLFTTVGAFYHARRRQWLAAGLYAAVAMATHSEGLVTLAPITLEFLAYYWSAGGWRHWSMLKIGWLFAPSLAALGIYALYSYSRTGYWLAFNASEYIVWKRRLSPPIYPFIGILVHPGIGSTFDFDFRLLNVSVAFVALALCVAAFRRLPPSYGLWILLGLLLPFSTDGSHMHALARYVGALFPVFVAMAAWSLKQRRTGSGEHISEPVSTLSLELRDRVALVPSLMLLAVFTLMFTAGVWAAI